MDSDGEQVTVSRTAIISELNRGPPLDLASRLLRHARAGYVPGLRLLISVGADVNHRYDDLYRGDITGRTALMEAVENGQVECAKVLIASGADVNMQDSTGSNALMLAIINDVRGDRKKDLERCVELLVQSGGRVTTSDRDGYSVIEYARRCKWLSPDCLQLLETARISEGADGAAASPLRSRPLLAKNHL